MCGIVGNTSLHDELEIMLERVAHRGPDGEGVARLGRISLGHRRLAIIDTSDSGSRPMHDPDSGNVLVFNGEIYNYLELRDELKDSYTFQSHCDPEVILAAYRRWGADCLERLRGMFSFALYDPELHEVLIARDRLGIKPPYYREGPGYFALASEIKALLGIGGLEHSLNESSAIEFLAARHLDTSAHTMFNEVKQLLPATARRVRLGAPICLPSSLYLT